jgi:hypothetical protein
VEAGGDIIVARKTESLIKVSLRDSDEDLAPHTILIFMSASLQSSSK